VCRVSIQVERERKRERRKRDAQPSASRYFVLLWALSCVARSRTKCYAFENLLLLVTSQGGRPRRVGIFQSQVLYSSPLANNNWWAPFLRLKTK
jgi:hypothetical protein